MKLFPTGQEIHMSQVSSTVRCTHQSPMFLMRKGKAGQLDPKEIEGEKRF